MAELTVYGIGVATADPEIRQVGDNQTSICTVNLAFNRSYQDKDREWKSEPTFIKAQIWGNRANKFAELVNKGQPVYIVGQLKQDSWTNKEGQKRIAFSIIVRSFQLCQKFEKNNDKNKNKESTISPNNSDYDNDDQIPF